MNADPLDDDPLDDDSEIGGVHIKYLRHFPRQLWLYARGAIVHETKSSRVPDEQHAAQVRHYCLLLERRGVNVRGGRVHYPVIRRTVSVEWDDEARAVIALPAAPSRLPRPRCRGCLFTDYCWGN